MANGPNHLASHTVLGRQVLFRDVSKLQALACCRHLRRVRGAPPPHARTPWSRHPGQGRPSTSLSRTAVYTAVHSPVTGWPCAQVTLADHEVLFEQGDFGDVFYTIVSGKVSIILLPRCSPRSNYGLPCSMSALITSDCVPVHAAIVDCRGGGP